MKRYWLHVTLVLAIFLMCGMASAGTVIDVTTGLPATESAGTVVRSLNQVSDSDTQDCGALWDLSHGVYVSYEPSGRYSDFVAVLAGQGYPVATTTNGVLGEDLSNYEILIISLGSSWNTPYTPAEVTAITNFVENGGRLLIMSDNRGCPNENINPVTEAFGTTAGISSLEPFDLTITNLNVHPGFTGVSSVFLRAAGELSVVAPSETIAWTDDNKPVMNAAESNRVIILGDINCFENYYLGNADNTQLALNLWNDVFCSTEHPSCGDAACNGDETCSSCPEDCGACPAECGDAVCDSSESCNMCPADCGTCAPEFPSVLMPATMIIGFLGAVFLIRRTRGH